MIPPDWTKEELELRLNAAMQEVVAQRNQALARCANLVGDLAAANMRIAQLEQAKPE